MGAFVERKVHAFGDFSFIAPIMQTCQPKRLVFRYGLEHLSGSPPCKMVCFCYGGKSPLRNTSLSLQWPQAISLSYLAGSGMEVPILFQYRGKVACGNSKMTCRFLQATPAGFQQVQQISSHWPESLVLPAYLKPSGSGGLLLFRAHQTRLYHLGQLTVGIYIASGLGGDFYSEIFQCFTFIFMLRPAAGTMGRDTRWTMIKPNCRRNLVAMLTTRSRGFVNIDVALLQKGIIVEQKIIPWRHVL